MSARAGLRLACRSDRRPRREVKGASLTEHPNTELTPNLHPAGFDELMPKTLATATVDRLLHHAHICQTSGDSIRLTQALDGKGVQPLT